MLGLPWLVAAAAAQDEAPSRPVELAAAVQVTYGAAESAGAGGPGHDVRVGLPLRERLIVEAGSASSDSAALELRAGIRWYLDEPWSDRGALSLAVAPVGVSILNTGYAASIGAAYDTPIRNRLVGRVSLEAVQAAGDVGMRASFGLVLPPKNPAPIIQTVYIDREVEAPEEAALAEEEMIWVPEPVCDWMPVDEAETMLAEVQAAAEAAQADGSGSDPEPVTITVIEEPAGEAAGADAVAASLATAAEKEQLPFWAPEQTTGSLIVIAHPGDKVYIEDAEVAVDARGVAMLTREEGLVEIEIASGGQRQTLRAGLVPGHAVWVRAGDPDPNAVYFELNSADLDRRSKAKLLEVAENAAGWSFVLQGGYSPEGTLEHNRQLAVERARGVSRALQDAGIPADRIVFLDPPRPDPNRTPQQQRTCRIIPVAPETDSAKGGSL